MNPTDPFVRLTFPSIAAWGFEYCDLVAFRELEALPPARRADILLKCDAKPACPHCGLPLVDGPVPCPYCATAAVREIGREVTR